MKGGEIMNFTNVLGFAGNQSINTTEIASYSRNTVGKGTTEEKGAFLRLVKNLLEENKQKGKAATELPDGLWQGLYAIFPQLQMDKLLNTAEYMTGEEVSSELNISPAALESIYLNLNEIPAEELLLEEPILTEAFKSLLAENQINTPAGTLESTEKFQLSSINSNENIPSLPGSSELDEVNLAPELSMEHGLKEGLSTASKLQSNNVGQVLVAETQEEDGFKPEVPSPIKEGIGQAFYRPVGLKAIQPGGQFPEEFEGSAEDQLMDSGQKKLLSGEKVRFSDLSGENEGEIPLIREVGLGQNTEVSINPILSAVSTPNIQTIPAEEVMLKKEELMSENIPGEKVVSQILKGAQMMVKDGVSKLQLELEPAELGKLELSIVVERDLVTAKFVTETEGVQSLIESNLPQLRSSLQEAGLRVDLLQVGVQTGTNPQMQYHSSSSGYKFAGNSSFTNGSQEMLAVEETNFGDEAWHGMVNMRV